MTTGLPKLSSTTFTMDQLDAIINAFYDIADVIDSHDFANQSGVTDPDACANFVNARNIIYSDRCLAIRK